MAVGEAEHGGSLGWYTTSNGKRLWIPLAAPTPDSVNSGPYLGPIVISTLYYFSPSGYSQYEYIKLTSVSTTPIDISGWTITGVITFKDEPITIQPGESVYLTRARDDDKFRFVHSLSDSANVITAAYTGTLVSAMNDTSSQLFLSRPSNINPGTMIQVDVLNFADMDSLLPKAGTKTLGHYLERLSDPMLLSYDPAAWDRKTNDIHYLPVPVAAPLTPVGGSDVVFSANVTNGLSTAGLSSVIERSIATALSTNTGYITVKPVMTKNPSNPNEYSVTVTFDASSASGGLSPEAQIQLAAELREKLQNNTALQLDLSSHGVHIPITGVIPVPTVPDAPSSSTTSTTPTSDDTDNSVEEPGQKGDLWIGLGAGFGSLLVVIAIIVVIVVFLKKGATEERV